MQANIQLSYRVIQHPSGWVQVLETELPRIHPAKVDTKLACSMVVEEGRGGATRVGCGGVGNRRTLTSRLLPRGILKAFLVKTRGVESSYAQAGPPA